MHIREYDMLKDRVAEEDHVIELTRFSELFEMTKVIRLFAK